MTYNAIASALYSKLQGTAITALLSGTAAIYRTVAPQNAVYPYVVFSQYAGGPMNETPSDWREVTYFVRAYGTTSARVGSIDAQVSNALHRGTLTVSGYTNFATWRELDVENLETTPTGQTIYSAGAIYRIMLDD